MHKKERIIHKEVDKKQTKATIEQTIGKKGFFVSKNRKINKKVRSYPQVVNKMWIT